MMRLLVRVGFMMGLCLMVQLAGALSYADVPPVGGWWQPNPPVYGPQMPAPMPPQPFPPPMMPGWNGFPPVPAPGPGWYGLSGVNPAVPVAPASVESAALLILLGGFLWYRDSARDDLAVRPTL